MWTNLLDELSRSILSDEAGELLEESSWEGGGEVEVNRLVEALIEVLDDRGVERRVSPSCDHSQKRAALTSATLRMFGRVGEMK